MTTPTQIPLIDSLTAWQSVIGKFAQSQFGPTPPDIHAVRLVQEAIDVVDHAATGRPVGEALGGVLVVALAMAHQAGLSLPEILKTEHELNCRSEWRQTGFGHWVRMGEGAVVPSTATAIVERLVWEMQLSPREAVCLLRSFGASDRAARDHLIAKKLAKLSDFETPPPEFGAQTKSINPPPFRLFSCEDVTGEGAWPSDSVVSFA